MKKGLILALTMVAMVALVMPVLALAPLVEPLPSVIIGDNETGEISGDNHLFRYNNVMNVATSSKIQWRNASLGFGDPQKHAYYLCDPVGSVQVSTPTRLVSEVTAGDIANIETAGAPPSAAKTITDSAGDGGLSDFFWLSLATNMSGATSSYTATAAANGKTLAQTVTTPVDMGLVLVDGDYPTTAASTVGAGDVAWFTVYTVPGGDDGMSGGGVTVYSASFDAGQAGWNWHSYADPVAIPSIGTGSATGGQIVMAANATAPALRFGTWVSGSDGTNPAPVVDVSAAAMGTNIYRGTFRLTSTSTNGATTLGFRILYTSVGFNHLGGITQYDGAAGLGAALNAPVSGTPKDIKVYWAPPLQLSEFGDTGKLATVQAGSDFRDYILNFDAFQTSNGDTGNLGLDNALVEMIAKPSEAATPLVAWGGSNNAFNSAAGTYGWVQVAAVAGLTEGTSNIGASTLTIGATTAAPSMRVVTVFGSATGLPDWQSDKLIAATATLATSSINLTPTYRMITTLTTPAGAAYAMQWGDVYDPDSHSMKNIYTTGNVAGAPGTSATPVVSYFWTHTAGSGVKIQPRFDCYQIGAYNGWAAPTGTLTMSGFKFAECQ